MIDNTTKANTLKVQQFRINGCYSYLVHDTETLEALVIDPVFEVMDYIEALIWDQDLNIKYAIDTHTHPDHFTGLGGLQTEYSATVGLSEFSVSKRKDLNLRDGDVLSLGSQAITIKYVGGHTADSIILLAAGHVFTGDSLLIGHTGRTNLPSSDAGLLYRSIHQHILSLPQDTIVHPGHDYDNLLFSTIGKQLTSNITLRLSEEEFIHINELQQENRQVEGNNQYIAFNESTELQPNTIPATSIPCYDSPTTFLKGNKVGDIMPLPKGKLANCKDSVEKEQLGRIAIIDVRESFELAMHEIDNALHVPLSSFSMCFDDLRKLSAQYDELHFICSAGLRSALAVATMQALGVRNSFSIDEGVHANCFTEANI